MTGSLSSRGRGPLTVTAFSRGQMRACVGVSVGLCVDVQKAMARGKVAETDEWVTILFFYCSIV